MGVPELEQLVRNVDRRTERIEQILPTLATKQDLSEAIAEAIAPLATKEELRVAIAPLATKEELRVAIAPLATKEELRVAIAPLATKEELRDAIAPLATKEELRVAIAPLATKEELRVAIAPLATKEELRDAIAPLATKEELRDAIAPLATKEALRLALDAQSAEMRRYFEETRRHFDVVGESLRADIRLLAEGQIALHQKVDNLGRELKQDIARLDARVTRLEASH